jgi:glycerol-3-phosphate dehydrogenase
MSRTQALTTHFDLVIIGGGIYGAALSYEAAQRGLKTALLEQNDFGAATSANSLKTIHGGVRYLQTLNLRRCWQSARERQILLDIAPHIVRPLPCVMPTTSALMKSKLVVGSGMIFYDLLTASLRNTSRSGFAMPRTSICNKAMLEQQAPSFAFEGHTGGAQWHDAQVLDSEQLGYAFIDSARKLGATALNYLRVQSVEQNDGGHCIRYTDCLDQSGGQLTSDLIVDCSSSWNVCADENAKSAYITGVNFVLKRQPDSVAVGCFTQGEEERRRLLFFSPWQQTTLAGTWYFPANGPEDLQLSDEQIQMCLDELNTVLKTPVTREDILEIHAGQMPAKPSYTGKADDPADYLQAENTLEEVKPGLFRLQSTKYTMARLSATQCLDLINKRSNKNITASKSHLEALTGGAFEAFEDARQALVKTYAGKLSKQQIDALFCILGDDTPHFLTRQAEATDDASLFLALCKHYAGHSDIHFPDDLLHRRLGAVPFTINEADQENICAALATEFDWSAASVAQSLNSMPLMHKE